jgi:hypothetical protein
MGGRLLELTAQQRGQVADEINRAVAEAKTYGHMLSTSRIAAELAECYDYSGLTADQIASEVVRAAAQIGLQIERSSSN